MYLPNGSTLKGTYKIVRFIASGGFGCTYEAQHIMLGKRVAIKEFFIENFCNRDAQTSHVSVGVGNKKSLVEKFKKKFIDEARAIAQMSYPNIVAVSDVFEENGTAYYVMDYVDGESLSQIVRKRGCLPEKEALRYITDVAKALKYVHSLNRLHLDIKPANIMIGRDGHVMLIDFGVSKQYDEINGENTSTLMGYSAGYAPVEQMGNRVKTFTPATDIYALGATFYSLLSGIMPPLDATDRADEDTLEPLPSVISAPVKDAIKKAMNVSRNGRVQSIDEFLGILSSNDSSVRSTSTTSKTVDERTLLSDNIQVDIHKEAKDFESEAAEERFNREAKQKLGWCYLCGVGVEQNETKAIEWYTKAAEQGDKDSKEILEHIKNRDLESLFLKTNSMLQYNSERIEFWKYIAKLGHAGAQYRLAERYRYGKGVSKDEKQAFKWYKKAAENILSYREAKQKLGWCYLCGVGVEQNETKAIEWYTKAAEQGDKDSKEILEHIKNRDLESLFLKAKSIPYKSERIELWKYIAKLGHAGAQYELAECYYHGWGVSKDEKQAFELCTKAAEQGYPEAQYKLGYWYECGFCGVKQDLVKAFELYSKAKDRNQDAARRAKALGIQLRNGPYANALRLYQKKQYCMAIKMLENVSVLHEAQYLLGECYFRGRGVPKDISKAIEWYTKAASQGNNVAKDKLAKINGSQSLESAPQKSESFNKDDLQSEASKQKENTDSKVHNVESQQQRKEQTVISSKENKETNPVIGFMKKIFS